jgi:PKD repeat protein
MRSIRWLAVITGALLAGSACGDGGGVGPNPNDPPVAGFSEVCTELSCVFTDTSTDPDGNATITAWSWNFGDNSPLSSTQSPTHVFPEANTYTVALTVTDDKGVTNTFSKPVTVQANVPGNTPPTAAFTVDACPQNTCTFNSSTSTDADGTIASYAWTFGDNTTSTEANPTHVYGAVTQATPYTVTLTVTDDDGAASAPATQTVTIQPPAPAALCANGGNVVDCTFDVTQRSTVTITVTDRNCELIGNRLEITRPVQKIAFFHLCNRTIGETYTIKDNAGANIVFEAGTQFTTRFVQGTAAAGNPTPQAPEIRSEGSFPVWTLRIDDGGAPDLPRNDDIVLTVTATPAP